MTLSELLKLKNGDSLYDKEIGAQHTFVEHWALHGIAKVSINDPHGDEFSLNADDCLKQFEIGTAK